MSEDRHSINCDEAVEQLYDLFDKELTPDMERQVRDHLEMCQRCFPLYRFELTFKRFLQARTRAQTAPPDLRRKIFDQLFNGADKDGSSA